MYKLIKDGSGNDRTDMILRTADNAYIPESSDNKDWMAYQAWLNDGNTPDASE